MPLFVDSLDTPEVKRIVASVFEYGPRMAGILSDIDDTGSLRRVFDNNKELYPGFLDAIRGLSKVCGLTGFVTGQDVGQAAALVDPAGGPEILYMFLAGRQIRYPGDQDTTLDPNVRMLQGRVHTFCRDAYVDGLPGRRPLMELGIRMTIKAGQAVFHYDGLASEQHEVASRALEEFVVAAKEHRLTTEGGAGFVQVMPPISFDKGGATCDALREATVRTLVVLGDSSSDVPMVDVAQLLCEDPDHPLERVVTVAVSERSPELVEVATLVVPDVATNVKFCELLLAEATR